MKTKKEFKKSLKLNEKCNYDFEYLYTCYLLGITDGVNDEREFVEKIMKSFEKTPSYSPIPSFPPYPSPITWDTTKVTYNNTAENKGDLN